MKLIDGHEETLHCVRPNVNKINHADTTLLLTQSAFPDRFIRKATNMSIKTK